MAAETSTYIYDGGAEETVTLSRGPHTPAGHALLKIAYSDGGTSDCYVDLVWLRDRADQLADKPRPLTPGAFTDEMVLRYLNHSWGATESNIAAFEVNEVRAAHAALTAALTEPPARPEGAEDIERLLMDADREGGEAYRADGYAGIADYLAARLTDPTRKEPMT